MNNDQGVSGYRNGRVKTGFCTLLLCWSSLVCPKNCA